MTIKRSFDPLDCPDARILILGSLPGDRSIAMGQYYGHPQNRFWRVISNLTRSQTPADYQAKKALLIEHKIALWDVAHLANRDGSMDSSIKNEQPNDIAHFIATHPNLRVIAFNGKKAEALYDKFFERQSSSQLHYLSLPSTSPANAASNLDSLCQKWAKIFALQQ